MASASKANGAKTKYLDVRGRIYSVFRVYGFIEVDISIKDRVYFNHDTFEDGRFADLLDAGIKAGDPVIVDFVQRPGTDLYRALSVRRAGYVRQKRQTAAEKIPSYLDDEEGVVCVLRDSHAFVRTPRFRGVTASFQKSDLEAYMGRRVATLTDVLELGMKLRFDAMQNPDDRSKTKWIVEKLRSVDGVSPGAPRSVVSPRDANHRSGTALVVTDTAYLHASVVEKTLEVDVDDLRHVLEEGSKVRFDADANGFQYGRGKWHVTRVELLGSSSCTSLFSVPSSAVSVEALGMRRLFSDGLSGAAEDCELHELSLEPRSPVCSDQEEEGHCDVSSSRIDVTSTRSRQNVTEECRQSPFPFKDEDEFPALPSREPEKGRAPSVSIYEDVSAVVESVTASAATCYVEHSGMRRTVQFAAGSFYRNGEAVSGELNRTLGEGDQLKLDYMVGTRSEGADIVHCDLAWQGGKPRRVPRMSADELLERLDVNGQLVKSEDEKFLHEMIGDDELSALLGESSVPGSDKHDNGSGAVEEDSDIKARHRAEASLNDVQRMTRGGSKRYVLTEEQVPAFARLILQQLESSRMSNSQVTLRHVSTQTEEQ
ncbi:hypothetical protein HPB50_018980 [Hyalomma asiaticum]|uniref:Uncharacterized protein n=1 Tax=Hyalomma asiaticum TaxID=266040 RepID=A0ACB7RLP9_HYAAI|nr:hypothetical protein HPB50_018980 [Hyalomma asiaticum]